MFLRFSRYIARILVVLPLLMLGTPASAQNFDLLFGGKRKPAGMPFCEHATPDDKYCWSGEKAILTPPKPRPVPQPTPQVQPAPQPDPIEKRRSRFHSTFARGQRLTSPVRPGKGTEALIYYRQVWENYDATKNAGMPGHNTETHANVGIKACAELCSAKPWCRSFDYGWAKSKCYLHDVTAAEVPLKFDYPGTPYDYFVKKPPRVEKPPRVATAIPADPTPAPLLTPTTACRKHLKGPNPWLDNQAKEYSSGVTDALCGPLESSTKPAECFHYLMSNQVAWDVRGMTGPKPNTYTRWGQQNAAALCAGSTRGVATVGCFGLHVARHRDWKDAMARCKG